MCNVNSQGGRNKCIHCMIAFISYKINPGFRFPVKSQLELYNLISKIQGIKQQDIPRRRVSRLLHRSVLRQNQLYKLNNNFGGIFHPKSLQPGSHKSAFWTNPSRCEAYTRKSTIFVKRQIEDKCNFSRFYCNKNLSQ